MSGAPGAPETSQGPETFENVKTFTEQKLAGLKAKIGEKPEKKVDTAEENQAELNDAIAQVGEELRKDLIARNINDKSVQDKLILEYTQDCKRKVDSIIADRIIESDEIDALEAFMSNPKNIVTQKLEGIMAKIDEIYVTVATLFGDKPADEGVRKKIYEAVSWFAGFLGIDKAIEGFEKGKKGSKEKKLTDMSIGELLAGGSKVGDEGKKEREYLGRMFDKDEFGTLANVTENSLTFNKKGVEIAYTIKKDSVSNTWEIELNGQKEPIHDLKNGAAPAARRLNQKILNT